MSNFKVKERQSFCIGEEAAVSRVFLDDDIDLYAKLSGDVNPVHINNEYAKATFFKGRIVHGILVSGLISSVLGNQLPGPGSIYISQELKFLSPVRPGDEVTARVVVTDWDAEKGRITLKTEVVNQNRNTVIIGQAKLVMSSFLKK